MAAIASPRHSELLRSVGRGPCDMRASYPDDPHHVVVTNRESTMIAGMSVRPVAIAPYVYD